ATLVETACVALRAAEGAEIDHPLSCGPRERAPVRVRGRDAPRRLDRTRHPAGGVDRAGLAVTAAERAEVQHSACRRPREGVPGDVAKSNLAPADDLTGGAHGVGLAAHAAERAEIDHPAGQRP